LLVCEETTAHLNRTGAGGLVTKEPPLFDRQSTDCHPRPNTAPVGAARYCVVRHCDLSPARRCV